MLARILASVALLGSILFAPFWVSTILGLAFMAYFSLYLEAVFIFFLSDTLYGVKEVKLFGMVFVASIVSVAVLLVVEFFKKKLRFYP